MLDYGIIGNCITAALVKKNASIDWLCFPKFDSPSIFAKIIDNKKGGSLEIKPIGKYKITQRYIPNTAILETTFTSPRKAFIVYDFFPRYKKLIKNKHKILIKRNSLVRIIKPIKGKPEIKIKYDPKPNYAKDFCEIEEKNNKLVCKSSKTTISFISNINSDSITKSEKIKLNNTKYIIIGNKNINSEDFNVTHCNKMLSATKRYWEKWCSTLILPNENKEIIMRSAITLKLLTYGKTGAILAAATTSIPDGIGTSRTFDYRFCWVRDAALCADALKKIGRNYESKKLMEFIIGIVLKNDYIQIMYGINGETKLKEVTLKHLEGFKGSKPVRIGNAAYNQIQYDIYGEILDIIYLYFVYYEYEKKMSKKYWRFIRYIVNQIKFDWERKDSGIWEFRGRLEHFTYSKFMCYIGVDRAIRIGQHFNRIEFMEDWLKLRDEIKEDILKNAYDHELNSFTMYYGGKELDASLLQMSYHEFLNNTDPRMINTIKAIYKRLRHDYLVQRYDIEDDFGKSKSSFTICSFWLVDALYSIGEEKKAREIFGKLIKKSNHLGLFSEDIDIKTKKLVGNFPQAYTHIAQINSAILLSEWSSKRKKHENIPKLKGWF